MKIHLLFKKEDIDRQKTLETKVVVIFDILLATSTIATALEFGAKEVIPVLNGAEAIAEANARENGSYVLVGEYLGKTIDGFLSPYPMELKEKIKGKTVILSTTNGTIALKNASGAKTVYASSILNSKAVADQILTDYKGETILLVCSGSSNHFNVEDFIGAGYFIDCLIRHSGRGIDITDAAFAAHQFFQSNQKNVISILKRSRVGQMLTNAGFEKEIEFIAQESLFNTVPYLADTKRIVAIHHDTTYIKRTHPNHY